MQKIHFSKFINASREKVWDTMFSKETYREWTKPFNPNSSFIGDWSEGSEIRFVCLDENGNNGGGMYSRIKENRIHEFVSIEHLGMIDKDGNIDTTSEEVKKWTPAFENYTFVEKDGGTEVLVDMDINEEMKEEFENMWSKALDILKSLSETA